jgi:hypothetical protein
MTDKNYDLALKHYSYGTVATKLTSLLANIYGNRYIYNCQDHE